MNPKYFFQGINQLRAMSPNTESRQMLESLAGITAGALFENATGKTNLGRFIKYLGKCESLAKTPQDVAAINLVRGRTILESIDNPKNDKPKDGTPKTDKPKADTPKNGKSGETEKQPSDALVNSEKEKLCKQLQKDPHVAKHYMVNGKIAIPSYDKKISAWAKTRAEQIAKEQAQGKDGKGLTESIMNTGKAAAKALCAEGVDESVIDRLTVCQAIALCESMSVNIKPFL